MLRSLLLAGALIAAVQVGAGIVGLSGSAFAQDAQAAQAAPAATSLDDIVEQSLIGSPFDENAHPAPDALNLDKLVDSALKDAELRAAAPARTRIGAVMPPEVGGYYTVHVTSYRDLPFKSVVRQEYDFSCGSAAVATLLRYHYGHNVDESTVFRAMYAVGDQAAIKAHGFSLADIQSYLKSVGLRSDGYRLSFETYARARLPALAIIRVGQYKHFVVIKGIDSGYVLVGDPAAGIKAYTIADFKKVWDGLIFVIHDESHPNDHHSFSNPAEWRELHHAPLEPVSHAGPLMSNLTELDHGTLFEVRIPNVASTPGT